MTNEEVKRRPGMASLHYIVISRRRRLAGHMLFTKRPNGTCNYVVGA